ncbi:sugar transporter SWEET1 [Biomphalaria pfeifferi]|uniref:Sugar transporter SWEET1 n=1 Tax=Biomphalaria pfeifferi TaxID=112525 RepID=A0AAD8FQJ3_BIOPF|nr:sugar transporter SWEET1 [Biomphalaria pfeifferi]
MSWVDILSIAATVTSFIVQFIGIKICFEIISKGNTGDISSIPFIAFFISTAIWLKYGLMTELTNVILTSALGTLLQLIYIYVYYLYCTKKFQFYVFLIIGMMLIVIPLAYVDFYESEFGRAKRNLGVYCGGLTILCYASPLATLSEVLKQKSTHSVSFPLCFVNFVSASLWTLYGAIIKDRVLVISNVFGIFLGFIQFYLFYKFGCRNTKPTHVLETP